MSKSLLVSQRPFTAVELREEPAARYVHDCDVCRYLGQHGDYDLYSCDQAIRVVTVIARHSSQDSDYQSGAEIALADLYRGRGTALAEAARRAIDLGHARLTLTR